MKLNLFSGFQDYDGQPNKNLTGFMCWHREEEIGKLLDIEIKG